MSEGAEWVGCELVRESAGPGPRASLSAAVARNGPQAGPAEDDRRAPKQAALPKVDRGCTQPTECERANVITLVAVSIPFARCRVAPFSYQSYDSPRKGDHTTINNEPGNAEF